MKLFIFHYHLQGGGVSRVIRSQVRAVRDDAAVSDVVLLTGRRPVESDFGGITMIVNPAWDYLDPDTPARECRAQFDVIRESLRTHIGPHDILHVHNPNLGKNPVFTAVLPTLAAQGTRLLLHCHDFAEDRPENLEFNRRVVADLGTDTFDAVMYPDAPNVVFGVLNTTDRARLLARGIEPGRVCWLPNPVALPEMPDRSVAECRAEICAQLALNPERLIFLYPVRAIGRKNLGELILFAALFGDRAHWLVTRAPQNPREKPEYERWCHFARAIDANVLFDVGRRMDFLVLLRGADRIVTTSVREGFGMTFLEPWLFDKPVVGRNLPDVTRDFLDSGLILNHLYDSLPVDERGTDFASLPASAQREWIRDVAGDSKKGCPGSEDLAAASILFADVTQQDIAKNRKLIEKDYSISAYGQKLRRVYRALSAVR